MEQITDFLKHWVRCAILMILGGVIGFVISILLPAQYSATTYLTTVIDYNRTGSLEELEQDRMLGSCEDVINSDGVLQAACDGISDCSPDFMRESMSISRTTDTWSLTLRGTDAKQTARLCSAWLSAAHTGLLDAHQHALAADALAQELDDLTLCISGAAASNVQKICEGDPAVISQRIGEISTSLEDQLRQSLGISSAIRIGGVDVQHIELKPASRSAAVCSLLGMLTGGLVAFALVWLKDEQKS